MNRLGTAFMALLTLTFSASLLVSCDEEEKNSTPVPGDYYPTQKNHRWVYVQTDVYRHDDGEEVVMIDTLHLQLGGRLKFADYTPVFSEDLNDSINYPYSFIGDADFLYSAEILKLPHEYFIRPLYYDTDELFLVDDKPIGFAWKARGMDCDVVQADAEKTVNGILYKNVIEIREKLTNKNTDINNPQSLETRHFYAKGVGEVFSFHKGIHLGYTHTTELMLLSHTK